MAGAESILRPAPPSPAARAWALGACLLALTAAAYLPALRNGFAWDDNEQFLSAPVMSAPDGLRRIWTGTETLQYYPVTFSAFWLERRLFGLEPFGYHLVSVLLHGLNALLVWGLLGRLRMGGAWLAAAIFALHPVQVESVAWATELKNVLSGAFFFLSLLCYLRSREEAGAAQEKPLAGAGGTAYLASLACFLAALLSKTSTVMLPVVLLILEAYPLNRRERSGVRRDLVLSALPRLAPFFLLSALIAGVTVHYEKLAGAQGAEWSAGLAQRAALAGGALWFYLGKLLWPHPLIFVYPRWSLDSFFFYLPAAAATAGVWLLWRKRENWAGATAALAYFAANLFPVLGFFDVFFMRYSFVADHFQYLASLGPIALACGAAARACRAWRPGMKAAAAGALLALLGGLSWKQAKIYKDEETLWADTLAKNQKAWVAHYNTGISLAARGKLPEAIGHYRAAAGLRPQDGDIRNNLALALMRQGALEEAEGEFQASLRIKPYAVVHSNLGTLLSQRGEGAKALRHFEQAVRLDPMSPEYRNRWAAALAGGGRPEAALAHYGKALELKPDYGEARYNRALALLALGKTEQALADALLTIRLRPDLAGPCLLLGDLLEGQGQRRAAAQVYSEALRAQPGLDAARRKLSALSRRRG